MRGRFETCPYEYHEWVNLVVFYASGFLVVSLLSLVPTLCVGTHYVGGSASCAGWLCLKLGDCGCGRVSVLWVIPTQSVGTSWKKVTGGEGRERATVLKDEG